MHFMLSDDFKESNTAKQINTATEINEFKDTLFSKKVIRIKMNRSQSKKHKTGTYEINKIWLECFDNKRFVSDNRIPILAYFHKGLRKYILTDDHRDPQRWS